jgi:hypothetical protein
MTRERIAIIIHFGENPTTEIGDGDKKDALKFWEKAADDIIKALPSLGYHQIFPEKLTVLSDEEKKLMVFPFVSFLKAHGDECDLQAVVENIVEHAAKAQLAHTIKEIGE